MLRLGSLAIAFLAALGTSLGASGCSAGGEPADSSSSDARLLSYLEEGGIGGPRPSLTVSKRARASLRLGPCSTSFGLRPGAWRRLRAALTEADIPAVAGEYPPPKESADEITYVVRSGGHEVRIAPAPLPENEKVLAQLEPLLTILGRTVASGQRRLPPGCASNRTAKRVLQGGSA
jgi:hypothetical protein